MIRDDFSVYKKHANALFVILFSRGFHAMLSYRIGNFLVSKSSFFVPIAFLLSRLIQVLYAIDIHWNAKIAGGCRIVHGFGLVIAANCKIGKNCSLYHGVTLGVKDEWTGEGPPIIGDNVKIYAGAKVIGGVTLANSIKVGANACVVNNLSIPNASYGGIPAKNLKYKHKKNTIKNINKLSKEKA